jgi:hypothetical protein
LEASAAIKEREEEKVDEEQNIALGNVHVFCIPEI